MKWHILFLIFFSCLFAEENPFNPEAAKETVLDQQENFFPTSTPNKIVPRVNPITGDLIEEEMDLIVAGSEPLSVRRFYNHTGVYEPRYGGWRYNPETFFFANFEWPGQEVFAAMGEFDGSIASYKPSSTPYTYTFNLTNSLTHFTPSGQTHPLNTKVSYYKIGDKDNKERFSWQGMITDGSGTQRLFVSKMHKWLGDIHAEKGKKTFLEPGSKRKYRITPNVWTPYQIPIYQETRPNGNIITYSNAKWKDDALYPTPVLISTITAYNSDKSKILGTLTFKYNQDKNREVLSFTTTGSDERVATFQHQGREPILLKAVNTPHKPLITYGYQGQWINQVQKPEGRILTTEYNTSGKVAAQYAPVGPNGEMHPIGKYTYHDKATEVYDAENNKTTYHFNKDKQILSIETQDRIDRFTWEPGTGNVLKKTVEDPQGKIHQITEYTYDKNHNPITEKIGDGITWHTITRTFSDDGFNLKLSESDREGKITRYQYKPGTNLLLTEFLYEKDKIRKRTFHTYDNCAICIKTITDDGTSTDPNDLRNITYRKILEIQPKQRLAGDHLFIIDILYGSANQFKIFSKLL